MNLKIKALGLLLISLVATVSADYAQTTIYFAVPSSTTFTNAYLDGGVNASEGSFPPSTVGASYFFNSTTGYSNLIQPCIGGVAWGAGTLTCQNGVARPAIITTNTGTVNQDFVYNVTSAIPSGWLACINGSKRLAADSFTVKSTCIMGDLNASGWARVALAVPPASAVNVTFYGNASNAPGATTSRTLTTTSWAA